MKQKLMRLVRQPWSLSFFGAGAVWLASIGFTHGVGAGDMLASALTMATFTVLVGVGQMFVITLGPGNVDLSLPANIGLSSAVAMTVMNGSDALVAYGLLAAVGSGLAIGIANYLLIWGLRIPPIIATLTSSFVVLSINISFGRGLQIKPPPAFADFANLQIVGLPVLTLLVLAFTVVAGFVLSRTVYGRWILATGQNPRAARFAGVKLEHVRLATYSLCGLLGGLDGALLAAYFRGSSVDIGGEYLLTSIAVVVIGGTSVAGGRANVPGIWGASLFLVLLLTMLNTFGASAGLRLMLTGLIIVAVIAVAGGNSEARDMKG
jgi:ribose transport system permease protein